jgi:hypothetical protein
MYRPISHLLLQIRGGSKQDECQRFFRDFDAACSGKPPETSCFSSRWREDIAVRTASLCDAKSIRAVA